MAFYYFLKYYFHITLTKYIFMLIKVQPFSIVPC